VLFRQGAVRFTGQCERCFEYKSSNVVLTFERGYTFLQFFLVEVRLDKCHLDKWKRSIKTHLPTYIDLKKANITKTGDWKVYVIDIMNYGYFSGLKLSIVDYFAKFYSLKDFRLINCEGFPFRALRIFLIWRNVIPAQVE